MMLEHFPEALAYKERIRRKLREKGKEKLIQRQRRDKEELERKESY